MFEAKAILAPAAVLALWTMIMLFWMAGTRLPTLRKLGPQFKEGPPGGRGIDLEPMLPASSNWKSHNYTHLVEQPTVYYAVILILFAANAASPLTIGLAWAYTGIRILHSLWQALVNRVALRFALFFVSSLCLTALAIIAVHATLT